MLITGSVAMVHHLGAQALGRKPSDTDYICTEAEWTAVSSDQAGARIVARSGNKGHIQTSTGEHQEFDIAQGGDSNDLLLDLFDLKGEGLKSFAPLDVLLLLKMSHRYKKNSPHFLKTMIDIHNLRKGGAKITPELETILKLREKETYTYSHPKLNVSKQEFFNGDDVPYTYDHDSIHEVVAFLDRPAYTYYMTEGEQVKASMDKFFQQDETIKLLGVLEESMVLASERSQIPNNFGLPPRASFNIALEKVCTSITSGKFREYAWEKYFIVQKLYDKLDGDEYVEKVKLAIKENRLRSFQEGMEG